MTAVAVIQHLTGSDCGCGSESRTTIVPMAALDDKERAFLDRYMGFHDAWDQIVNYWNQPWDLDDLEDDDPQKIRTNTLMAIEAKGEQTTLKKILLSGTAITHMTQFLH